MQLTNGNLYWQKKAKIEKIYPYLTKDKSCDVLVVGGGITGAITAYFLAKEGAKVIVVEKNIIGYGSTSAATASLGYDLDINMSKLEKKIGNIQAKKIYDLSLNSIDKLEEIDSEFEKDTDFKRKDSIYYSNKFMQKPVIIREYETRRNAGFNTALLNSHDVINLNSGIYTKNGSGVMNPYKFTQGLFKYLSGLENVEIYENTKIESIKCKYEYVESRTNNNFKIKSDNLIFSSGVESLKYLNSNLVDVYKTFTIVSKPINSILEKDLNFTAKDSGEPGNYLRFTKNGRVIFSGENIKMSDKFMDKKYMQNVANERYKRLFNTLQKTMFTYEDIPIEYAFNGTFANTRDNLPIVDEINGMPNCFCNLGIGPNGILYSAIRCFYVKRCNKRFIQERYEYV
jgi:glycine/D-amino acid oxidase-like deaminating enzyme